MDNNEFLKKIAESEGKEKYQIILKYAWFLRQNDPLKSINQSLLVLQYAQKYQENDLELTALAYLCYACYYNSDIQETQKWIDKLEKAARLFKNNRSLGITFSMKSRLALQSENTSLAMEHALTSLEFYLKDNQPSDLISSYFSLGIIHLQREENAEAQHYLHLALQYAEEINNHAQYSIRVNLGNILLKETKYQLALQEYLICLRYFEKQKMISSMAAVLLNIGICQRHLQKFDPALENMKKAYHLFQDMNNLPKIGFAANAIAELFIQQQDFLSSLNYLKIAEKIALENDFKIDLLACYNSWIKFYEATDQYLKANEYLHKLIKLKDKINLQNNQEKLSVLETQYKTQIYRLKNAELDKKNKAMKNQNSLLKNNLQKLLTTHKNLQSEFEDTVLKLNSRDDLISTQSRMAMMGEMISVIAHQWKQPLSIVWVMVQAIGDAWEFDELDDQFMQNQIKLIEEQIMYMSETTSDFRNFFNKDYCTDFKVAKAIDKSVKLVSYLLNQQNIKLIKNLDEDCSLIGNPHELSQVLINIINNASEAMIHNNVNHPCINLSLNCQKHNITINVFNNGTHIDPQNLNKIFQPYYTSKGKDGTGIGLSICQNIIKNKFHGSISAQNINSGVQFQIIIPQK